MSKQRVDSTALVFGIIFAAIAGWWLLNRLVNWHLPNAGWIIAGILIAVGAVGVARSLRSRD